MLKDFHSLDLKAEHQRAILPRVSIADVIIL